jgi:hypothetical protein
MMCLLTCVYVFVVCSAVRSVSFDHPNLVRTLHYARIRLNNQSDTAGLVRAAVGRMVELRRSTLAGSSGQGRCHKQSLAEPSSRVCCSQLAVAQPCAMGLPSGLSDAGVLV